MQKERKYTQVTAHTLSRCLTQRLQQEEKTKLMSWSLWSSFPFITEAPKALRASNNIFPHTHKSGASFVCINSGSRCLRSFCLSTKRPHTRLITCDVVVVLPLWERRSKPTTDQTEIFHFWICFEYFPQQKKKNKNNWNPKFHNVKVDSTDSRIFRMTYGTRILRIYSNGQKQELRSVCLIVKRHTETSFPGPHFASLCASYGDMYSLRQSHWDIATLKAS